MLKLELSTINISQSDSLWRREWGKLNLVPRVLSFPSPWARERREGEDPGNEADGNSEMAYWVDNGEITTV